MYRKSQLAVRYASEFVEENKAKHWVLLVRADNKDQLEKSYRYIAQRLHIIDAREPDVSLEKIIGLVSERLCEEQETKWLLIYDNLNDLNVFREANMDIENEVALKYLPSNPNGSIIVTSQSEREAKCFFGELNGDHECTRSHGEPGDRDIRAAIKTGPDE